MSFVRNWLFDNLGLKFVALLLAVIVYLNVFTDRPATMVISFPLKLTGLADSLSLSGPVPAAVQAEIRGTGKQLIRLRLQEPMLEIPLGHVGTGRFERAITAADLPLPEGTSSVERMIGPMTLELRVEPRLMRELPVAIRLEGMPAEGHPLAGEARADPPFVVLSGPASAIAALDSVVLDAVRIEGARDTVRAQAVPDGLPQWCEADPPTVTVIVPVAR